MPGSQCAGRAVQLASVLCQRRATRRRGVPRLRALGLVRARSPGNDARVEELAERFLDAFARAKLLDHAIERKGKLADLIARANHYRLRISTDSIARALATS